jgi:hypothetical protein
MELMEKATATPVPPEQDLRRSPRYKVNLHVLVSALVQGAHKLIPAYGRNIGEGGMCVFVPAQLALGDLIELSLRLPGMVDKVAFRARIRNVERFNYSIEFAALDERARQNISASCRFLEGRQ